MSTETFSRSTILPVSQEQAFAWHERPGAFSRMAPPWQHIQLVERRGTIQNGDRLTIRVPMGPMRVRWTAEHCDFDRPRQFCDVQVEGPFAQWRHTHRFEPTDDGQCRLTDEIEYKLPGGPIGKALGGGHARKTLKNAFAYRHRTLVDDLTMHAAAADRNPLTVAISGSHGMVGDALSALLTTGGHRVIRLVRKQAQGQSDTPSSHANEASERADDLERSAVWDPREGVEDAAALEGVDAVVHLAGENIARGRWTEAKKQRILESRVAGTRSLVGSLAKLSQPPRVFVCASAVGVYGDRGNEALTEAAPPPESKQANFLSDVCRQWESAAGEAEQFGARVACARLGVVLSPTGGALAKMLPAFKMGGGGPLGSGKQWMSWISLNDAISALHHIIMCDDLAGPVNLTAPQPVTNGEFGRTLGRVLRRPAFMPLPTFAARLMFGQMADELLLASARVLPDRLNATNHHFRDPDLQTALRWLLGRPPE